MSAGRSPPRGMLARAPGETTPLAAVQHAWHRQTRVANLEPRCARGLCSICGFSMVLVANRIPNNLGRDPIQTQRSGVGHVNLRDSSCADPSPTPPSRSPSQTSLSQDENANVSALAYSVQSPHLWHLWLLSPRLCPCWAWVSKQVASPPPSCRTAAPQAADFSSR